MAEKKNFKKALLCWSAYHGGEASIFFSFEGEKDRGFDLGTENEGFIFSDSEIGGDIEFSSVNEALSFLKGLIPNKRLEEIKKEVLK